MHDVYEYIVSHREQAVADLVRLCRQPSISAQHVGLQEMAELLCSFMTEIGIDARLQPTSTGVPLVYGELRSRVAARTLLFYNHYDVQPVDPLELWDSPPFEPEIRNGRVYARGATDNKGNIVSRMVAVKAFLAVRGMAPVNLKFMIDGQEESGSPGLANFVEGNRDLLRADGCVWEDTMGRIDAPVVSLGNKGNCKVELRCRVADIDSHSAYAGVYPSAVWRLVWALASIKSEDEMVHLDSFYDSVRPLSLAEEEMVRALPAVDGAELRRIRGIRRLVLGLDDHEIHRRQTLEPTLNIGGMWGGYQGKGTKTVIPAEATARLDARLVPDQDPHQFVEQIRAHLLRRGFEDIEVSLLATTYPCRTPLDNPLNDAIVAASWDAYGKAPIFEPHQPGGTPQWVIDRYLGIPCSATGVGYVTCMSHAPNENIRIDHLVDGSKYMAAIMMNFAQG